MGASGWRVATLHLPGLARGESPCEQRTAQRSSEVCRQVPVLRALHAQLSLGGLFSRQSLCSPLLCSLPWLLSGSRCPNGLLCPVTFWFDLLQLLPLLNSVRLAPPPVIKRRTFQVDFSSSLPVSKLTPTLAINQLAACLSSPTEGFPRGSGRAEGLHLKWRKTLM